MSLWDKINPFNPSAKPKPKKKKPAPKKKPVPVSRIPSRFSGAAPVKPKPKPEPRQAPRYAVNPSTGGSYRPGPATKGKVTKPKPKPIAKTPPRPAGGHAAPQENVVTRVKPKGPSKAVIAASKKAHAKKPVTSGSHIPRTGTVSKPVKSTGASPVVTPSGPTAPVGISGAITDKTLASRAGNAAAMEFDPKINELNRLKAQTTLRGTEGEKSITDMFNALSKTIQERGTTTNKDYLATQGKVSDAYNNLKTTIGSNYDTAAAADNSALARLGINAAGTSGSIQANADRANAQSLAGLQGQNTNSALEILRQGASNRATEQASGATGEGMMRSQDLSKQVRDALTEYGGQLVDLQGSKGKMTRELTEQYRNEAFSQSMAQQNLGYQYDQLAAQMGLAGRQLDWDKQKTGIAAGQAAAELGAKTNLAQATATQKANEAAYKNASPLTKLMVDANRAAGRTPAASGKLRGTDYTQLIRYAFDQANKSGKPIKSAEEAGTLARSFNNRKFLLGQKWHQVNSNTLQDLAGTYWTNVYKQRAK